MEKYICCFCKKEFKDHGNNPAPLIRDTDKNPNRCCDDCNLTVVIPERLRRINWGNEKCSK